MTQHTADRFYIYTVLEGQGCKGVSEVVEANVFQVGILQDFFMELHYRVGVVHLPGDQRGEQVRIVWVFAMFLDQQIYCVLRDGYLPYRGLRLWPGEHYLAAGVSDVLFTDRDRLVLCVQVAPEERHQFAFPQSADQLQIEHGEYPSGVGGVQVGFQVFWQERLHFYLLYLGSDAVIGRVAWDEPLFHCSLKCAVQGEVYASDCSTAKARVAL